MDLQNTKHMLSNFGSGDNYTPEDAERVHQAIAESGMHFGLVRFKIGALLLTVKNEELWRGKARSFAEYLESERIKQPAARQYMRVAEKFLFELKLDDEHLLALSRVSMTTLVKACDRITKSNMSEVVHLLEGLSDRDAIHALDDFDNHTRALHERKDHSPKVRKMISEFYGLPNDLRVEVLQALRVPTPAQPHAERTAVAVIH